MNLLRLLAAWFVLVVFLIIMTGVMYAAMSLLPKKAEAAETGIASWYGRGFHGRLTASGERFDQNALTCAHPSLPVDQGIKLRVTNLGNGRSVDCRVNDRGPFVSGRSIDLSRAAAERLGMIRAGVATVEIREVSP